MSNINNYPRDKIPDCWIPAHLKEKTKAKKLVTYLLEHCPLGKEDSFWIRNVYQRRVKMFQMLEEMTDKEFEDIVK